LVVVGLVSAACALVGCTNDCKKGTALVSFELRGAATGADALDVVVAIGSQSRTSTIAPSSSSGSFEVDFASGYPATGQTLAVSITARHGGDVLGSNMTTASIAPRCTALSIEIDGPLGAGDGDLADSDGSATTEDLATAACSPANGQESIGCPATLPICDVGGACRRCAHHAECELGVCKPDGTCAGSSEITFVDRDNASCSDAAHASTPSAPYCQIQAAIDSGGRPFAHVAPSATDYDALLLTGTTAVTITIVGPGSNLPAGSKPVSIYDPQKIGVFLSTQAPVDITLDGLQIHAGNAAQQPAVKCSLGTAAAAITLHDCFLGGGGMGLVSTGGCTVTMDASRVDGALLGAMNLDGPFTITNSFFHGNNGAGQYNSITVTHSYPQMLFAFNTVVANAAPPSFTGGVVCPSSGANVLIQNSIIVGNTEDGGSQFAGNCVLQNVVTGTDSFAGATQLTPTFVSTTDLHLVANDAANTACCVDKITNPTTPNKDHDVDGSRRPKGGASDIGAHEVQ